MKSESWVGLESNPAVMTQYAVKLGVSERWAFSDCWGLDRDALKHVPAPCVGCIFLYPFSQVEARKRTLGARRGCEVPGVWHMKQLAGSHKSSEFSQSWVLRFVPPSAGLVRTPQPEPQAQSHGHRHGHSHSRLPPKQAARRQRVRRGGDHAHGDVRVRVRVRVSGDHAHGDAHARPEAEAEAQP